MFNGKWGSKPQDKNELISLKAKHQGMKDNTKKLKAFTNESNFADDTQPEKFNFPRIQYESESQKRLKHRKGFTMRGRVKTKKGDNYTWL